MKKPLCLLLLFLFGICIAEIRINPENAVISAPASEKSAADELKKHLDLITGADVPIVYDGKVSPGKFLFHIALAPKDADVNFKPEEARWLVTPSAAYFYGEGKNGARFAVYDFLESALGVRWPGGDRISVRKMNPILVENTSGDWVPSLNLRQIRGKTAGMGIWSSRMRYGGHNQPVYGHAFTNWWDRFGTTHPEYFALNKGIRFPIDYMGNNDNVAASKEKSRQVIALCVSSDAVVKQIIADWDKKSEYINICENDAPTPHSCHCEKCCALDALKPGEKWHQNLTDRYVFFANRVLTEAQKYKKDVKVSMYSYNASEQPPRRERPLKNVVIGIVPTLFDMDSIHTYVGGWKKAGLNRFFYRPNRHYYYANFFPCGYEKHFFGVFQYMCGEGALGFDYDSPGASTPAQWFTDYVIYKGMQDPSKPFEYWEKHYMQAYGEAAGDISAYYRYWREKVWNARIYPKLNDIVARGKWFNFARGLMWNVGDYYKESDFVETDRILAGALKKALTHEQRGLVEEIAAFNTHSRLIFMAAYKKDDAASLALLRYREANKLELLPAEEKYWGDICGVNRVMYLKDFMPPFLETPLFWAFKLDPEDAGLKQEWFKDGKKIYEWGDSMPTNGPWETPYKHYKLPSEKTRELTKNYDGIAWYGCSVEIPAEWKDRRVHLFFGAVDESCWIYVNGKEIGKHLFEKPTDWATPFTIDITDGINWNEKTQYVIVRVEDKSGSGGIWKRVMLISGKTK